jgi:hypothetical protein
LNAAEALATIAARQRHVLGDDAARPTYDRVFSFANEAAVSDFGYYGYVKIVRRLAETDDLTGVRWAIACLPSSRDQAKCLELLAENHIRRGCLNDALAAAKDGVDRLSQDEPIIADADTLMRLAKWLALAHDVQGARKQFNRAKAISARNESKHHAMIARWELQAGLFEQAYATIQGIPENSARVLPLAELARSLANSEAAPKQ